MVNSRTRLLFSLFFPPRHPSGFRFRLPPCDRLLPVILTTPPVIDRPRLKKGREKSKRKVVSRRESRIFGVENNRRSFLRQSNGFPVLAFVKRVVQTYLRSLSLFLSVEKWRRGICSEQRGMDVYTRTSCTLFLL